MIKRTEKSLLIVSSLAYPLPTVLKHIELAQAFRQTHTVGKLARLLISSPVQEYRLIGQYYLVWCQCRESKYPSPQLETIIDRTQTYKTKALLTRGAFEAYQGKTDSMLYFYLEALKTTNNISDFVEASRNIAVAKSLEGFHHLALKDLEKLSPLLKYVAPVERYHFLNSLAFELNEAGRAGEARGVSRIVLASPFISAYPEWQETAEGLRGINRSFIVPDPSPVRMGKLLSMPPVEQAEPTKQDRPAPIISLEQWKKKMVKEDNDKPSEEIRAGHVYYEPHHP
jgi:hypothetical protein